MKKLLFVNCCLRGERSRTLTLCRDYLAKFMQQMETKGETWEIEEIDLGQENIAVQDLTMLEKAGRLVKAKTFNDPLFAYAKQLIAADRILIGAPYWDLDFPAQLKVYLERCSVNGLTFIYGSNGIPYGQCRAEQLVYITTAGGVIGDMNYGFDYVKGLFGYLLGVKETAFISAEALDIIGNDVEKILEAAKEKISRHIEKL